VQWYDRRDCCLIKLDSINCILYKAEKDTPPAATLSHDSFKIWVAKRSSKTSTTWVPRRQQGQLTVLTSRVPSTFYPLHQTGTSSARLLWFWILPWSRPATLTKWQTDRRPHKCQSTGQEWTQRTRTPLMTQKQLHELVASVGGYQLRTGKAFLPASLSLTMGERVQRLKIRKRNISNLVRMRQWSH
jgi:hypothetical protein